MLAGTREEDTEEESKRKAEMETEFTSLIDSIFVFKTPKQTYEYMRQNKDAIVTKIIAIERAILRESGTRRHISGEERRIGRLTHGTIDDKAKCVCYALNPREELDPTDFRNLGFIKHVLFLKIQDDDVTESWTHFAKHSSEEEREAIKAFLHGELGLKKHRNPYKRHFFPVPLDETESKLKKAGWRELNLSDDYEYQLNMSPEWILSRPSNGETEAKTSGGSSEYFEIRDAIALAYHRSYFFEKSSEQANKFKAVTKIKEPEKPWKYVRTHLSDEYKTIEWFTEGKIKNDSTHKCFSLPSDVEPDLANDKKCGFIKHVLFLEIEDGEITRFFLHCAVQSTKEQVRSILDFMGKIGLFYSQPEIWVTSPEMAKIAADYDDCF